MKKAFTLIAAACMLASTAAAQPTDALQFRHSLLSNLVKAPSRAAYAPEDAPEVITEAEGEAKNYNKTYFVNYMGYVEETSAAATIVFGADNTVYFADPISMFPTGSYIKGTVEGNKITVAYPQCLMYSEEDGVLDFTLLEPTDEMDEETEMPIANIQEPGTVTYTIGEDGVITLDPLPDNCALGLVMFGTMYMGICEFDAVYTPDSREVVTPPADLETTTYSYKMNDNYGHTVQIGFDDKEVYFTNVSTDVPDFWFKGTIGDDGKIHIPNLQYMGSFMGALEIYTFIAKPIEESPYMAPADPDAEYTFDYDPATGKIYNGSSDLILLINAGNEEIKYLCQISSNGFWKQESYAGTPRDPYDLVWEEGKNFNYFDFYLPNVDVDGNLMLNENLYYNLFYDGEVVEINPEEFGSDSNFTNIPFDYNKNMIVRDRFDGAHEIGVKVWGLESIGIQLINIVDGKEYRSKIAEIKFGSTGIDNIGTDASPVVSSEYFDLTGRSICKPGNGFVIRRDRHADGTVTTVKTVR